MRKLIQIQAAINTTDTCLGDMLPQCAYDHRFNQTQNGTSAQLNLNGLTDGPITLEEKWVTLARRGDVNRVSATRSYLSRLSMTTESRSDRRRAMREYWRDPRLAVRPDDGLINFPDGKNDSHFCYQKEFEILAPPSVTFFSTSENSFSALVDNEVASMVHVVLSSFQKHRQVIVHVDCLNCSFSLESTYSSALSSWTPADNDPAYTVTMQGDITSINDALDHMVYTQRVSGEQFGYDNVTVTALNGFNQNDTAYIRIDMAGVAVFAVGSEMFGIEDETSTPLNITGLTAAADGLVTAELFCHTPGHGSLVTMNNGTASKNTTITVGPAYNITNSLANVEFTLVDRDFNGFIHCNATMLDASSVQLQVLEFTVYIHPVNDPVQLDSTGDVTFGTAIDTWYALQNIELSDVDKDDTDETRLVEVMVIAPDYGMLACSDNVTNVRIETALKNATCLSSASSERTTAEYLVLTGPVDAVRTALNSVVEIKWRFTKENTFNNNTKAAVTLVASDFNNGRTAYTTSTAYSLSEVSGDSLTDNSRALDCNVAVPITLFSISNSVVSNPENATLATDGSFYTVTYDACIEYLLYASNPTAAYPEPWETPCTAVVDVNGAVDLSCKWIDCKTLLVASSSPVNLTAYQVDTCGVVSSTSTDLSPATDGGAVTGSLSVSPVELCGESVLNATVSGDVFPFAATGAYFETITWTVVDTAGQTVITEVDDNGSPSLSKNVSSVLSAGQYVLYANFTTRAGVEGSAHSSFSAVVNDSYVLEANSKTSVTVAAGQRNAIELSVVVEYVCTLSTPTAPTISWTNGSSSVSVASGITYTIPARTLSAGTYSFDASTTNPAQTVTFEVVVKDYPAKARWDLPSAVGLWTQFPNPYVFRTSSVIPAGHSENITCTLASSSTDCLSLVSVSVLNSGFQEVTVTTPLDINVLLFTLSVVRDSDNSVVSSRTGEMSIIGEPVPVVSILTAEVDGTTGTDFEIGTAETLRLTTRVQDPTDSSYDSSLGTAQIDLNTLVYTWTIVSGPSTVAFSASGPTVTANPTAQLDFFAPGTYTFQVCVDYTYTVSGANYSTVAKAEQDVVVSAVEEISLIAYENQGAIVFSISPFDSNYDWSVDYLFLGASTIPMIYPTSESQAVCDICLGTIQNLGNVGEVFQARVTDTQTGSATIATTLIDPFLPTPISKGGVIASPVVTSASLSPTIESLLTSLESSATPNYAATLNGLYSTGLSLVGLLDTASDNVPADTQALRERFVATLETRAGSLADGDVLSHANSLCPDVEWAVGDTCVSSSSAMSVANLLNARVSSYSSAADVQTLGEASFNLLKGLQTDAQENSLAEPLSTGEEQTFMALEQLLIRDTLIAAVKSYLAASSATPVSWTGTPAHSTFELHFSERALAQLSVPLVSTISEDQLAWNFTIGGDTFTLSVAPRYQKAFTDYFSSSDAAVIAARPGDLSVFALVSAVGSRAINETRMIDLVVYDPVNGADFDLAAFADAVSHAHTQLSDDFSVMSYVPLSHDPTNVSASYHLKIPHTYNCTGGDCMDKECAVWDSQSNRFTTDSSIVTTVEKTDSYFTCGLYSMGYSASIQSGYSSSSDSSDLTWLWIVLAIVGALILLILGYCFYKHYYAKQKQELPEENDVQISYENNMLASIGHQFGIEQGLVNQAGQSTLPGVNPNTVAAAQPATMAAAPMFQSVPTSGGFTDMSTASNPRQQVLPNQTQNFTNPRAGSYSNQPVMQQAAPQQGSLGNMSSPPSQQQVTFSYENNASSGTSSDNGASLWSPNGNDFSLAGW